MIQKNKKNDNKNLRKLNYICYDKIKSIPKQNYIRRKNFNKNIDLFNYNNSLDVGPKLYKKIKKTSLKNKPLLSERIKRNLSKSEKRDIQLGSISVEKSDIFNINQTENYNNNTLSQKKIFDYYNNEPLYSISPSSNNKNIYDQNIIINNNNYDKKIIFYGEHNDYNPDENINLKDIYTYNMQQDNYINTKNEKYHFNPNNNQRIGKNNYNQSFDLSELSNNNIKFKSMKILNKLHKHNMVEENINLKSELDKFLKENYNLKIKMNSLQKNPENNENISKQKEKRDLYSKKRKHISSKKSWDISYNYKNDDNLAQDNYNSQTTDRKNFDNKKNLRQMNTIFDSMQFKIKKRKLSVNYNNVNKIINFNNSININNQSSNNKKLYLMNNSYNKAYNDSENEKYFEELNNMKNDEDDEENKIKEDSIDMNQIVDLKTSKKSINVIESNQLQEKISIIKEESDKLNNKYKSLAKEYSELQQKYNSLYNINELVKKKNEIYLKCIDEQQKKIKSNENKINFLENEIKTKYKKTEEDLITKLSKANEIIIEKENKIKIMQKDMQKMKEENYSLYKFKSNYSDKEIEYIETKNELRKLENINNKYETLKFNYEEIMKQNIELKGSESKYKILNSEFDKLKEIENKYINLNNKYNELIEENNNLKEEKQKQEELNENIEYNNKLNEYKNKYEKLNEEVIKLREIREKYHQILKEQNNLLIIQNKYNDLIEEVQDLKEYKIKYDSILYNNGNKINSTETEKELSKKINENNQLLKKLEDIYNNKNKNLIIENTIDFTFKNN